MRRVWHPVDECLVAAGLVLMGIGAVGLAWFVMPEGWL